ncbi:MAG: GIY-YIG nuclease family protein [Pirellula sp.]
MGKLRWELDHPGVYLLFGEDEDGAKPIVYTGQTEDARKRFDAHNKTKKFWKTAVFCVSKSQNFTQAHIRYLRRRLPTPSNTRGSPRGIRHQDHA